MLLETYFIKRSKQVQPVISKEMQAVLNIKMDLFTQSWTGKIRDKKDEYFCHVFGESWFKQVGWIFDEPLFNLIADKVREARRKGTVYPDSDDLFRAFKLCSFEDLKVVLIGQDPYHNGNADGLAFSCKNEESPSWKVIEIELNNDIQFGRYLECYGKLDHWAKQGVLLLNSCLTVDAGVPRSHNEFGWDWFVKTILQHILCNKKHVVFNLWGGDARKVFNNAAVNIHWEPNHYVIDTAHPMVEQYKKSNPSLEHEFFGLKPFSRTNAYLIKHHINPVNW